MHPVKLPRDTWPGFVQLFDEFRRESERANTVVLVEGERDRAALRRLGLRGEVLLLHRGHSLATVARDLQRPHRRVILFTDWDTEGGHLARRVRELLDGEAVELDLEFRKKFARLLRGELVHVEGLGRWAERQAGKAGGSLEHFLAPTDD